MEPETADPSVLLKLAQLGDSESFCELCRIYEGRLVRQATALCGDVTAAEDLAQETLVEAWKCLHRYNGTCQFFTWLCAILLNRFRNFARQKRPCVLSHLAAHDQENAREVLDSLADQQMRPDEMADWLERTAALRENIQRLPAKHREVIHLRFYVDDSLEGIAVALGCSVGTVKSRLFYALERLRAMNKVKGESNVLMGPSDL